jgi:hypothetical protein
VNANVGHGLPIGSFALRLDRDNNGKISALPSSDGLLAESNSCAAMIKHVLDRKTNTPLSD